MVGENLTDILVDVPYDPALYPKEIDYHDAIGLAVRKAFVHAFLSDFRQYFEGKRIGDIGCGEALPRQILPELGINCDYTGIDKSMMSGCGSGRPINKPDIYWDYKTGPGGEDMVFDTVLWLMPTHLFDVPFILPYVKREGHLVLQTGGIELEDVGIPSLELCEKKSYRLNAKHMAGIDDYHVSNVFLLWQKN